MAKKYENKSEEVLQASITKHYKKYEADMSKLAELKKEAVRFKDENELLRDAFYKRDVTELEGHVDKANEALEKFKEENYPDYNNGVFG